MSFFGIMAIPMAMNLLGGMFRPKPPSFNPSYFSSMNSSLSSRMAKHSASMQKMWEKPPTPRKVSFDFDVPKFPQEAGTKFEQIQQQHEGERMTFLNKMQNDKAKMKEEFFAKNHCETKEGPDGKSKVVTKNGKPVMQPGKESAPQKSVRLSYEATQKAEMFAKHAGKKQEFVQQQKGQITQFLDGNKFQLHNPGIQGELQKTIADAQKKSIKLQDEHEEEYYKMDLPPVKGMEGKIDKDLEKYREMQAKQMEEQENSPQARELADYQQDLVALLDAKRAEARDRRKSEMFLRDPRKMLANPPRQDIAVVLPMNMVAALEQFGINDLPS